MTYKRLLLIILALCIVVAFIYYLITRCTIGSKNLLHPNTPSKSLSNPFGAYEHLGGTEEGFTDIKTDIGFIVLRHVNNEFVNNYWNHSYRCIRKFYPEHSIVIIDNHSNYDYVKPQQELYKTTVVQSEFENKGEFMPYYYYLKYKYFDTAVILQDSVFINSYIDFNVDTYKFIWEFGHDWDQIEDETRMIKLLNDPELLEFYNNKDLWKGCFGSMSIIKHDYLKMIDAKYDICKLLDAIQTRYNCYSLERVIGCLLQKHGKKETLFGDIHQYCPWGIKYDEKEMYSHLPIIKVWTGR